MSDPFRSMTLDALHARRSLKWSRHPGDVIPAWVADMDFPIARCISEAMVRAINESDLGYPPDDQLLANAFVSWSARRWGYSPNASLAIPLPDVVRGIRQCLDRLTEPGDSILVTTPIYPPFLNTIEATGRSVMEMPLNDDWRIDWSAIRMRQPAIVLLSNPHNPMGRVFDRDELEQVAALGVLVISDEIHADLVYADSPRHIPFASLNDEVAARTITITSASKAFNLAGLRCALMLPGTEELAERLAVDHEPIGTLGIVAAIAAWSDHGAAWLADCVAVLDENRRTIAAWAADNNVGHRSPQATYLAWLDFSAHEQTGDDPAQWLLDHARVALSFGPDFGQLGTRHARLNFATSPAILGQILERIAAALRR